MRQNEQTEMGRLGRGTVRIYDSAMDDCRDCCFLLASISIHES